MLVFTIIQYKSEGMSASSIPNNSYGYIVTAGLLDGIDTSHLSVGQVFTGITDGATQTMPPVYPNFPMCLGFVVKVDSTEGVIFLAQQNHSIKTFRVQMDQHIGGDLTIDGNLNVTGTTSSTSTSDVTAGAPFYRANEGDAIGEAGTTFTGTGLDDAFFSGHYTGTATITYDVKIDGVGSGTGGVDTFAVSRDGFVTTFSSANNITGNKQLIHSGDNIYVEFGATTGHTLNDNWEGTASPVNVDTGFWTNRNTGTSGVGYTHMGIWYDASTSKWYLTNEYDPVPSGTINRSHSSYTKATLNADLEGNVTGNVTGALSGNATSATALETARTIGGVSFDGSANINLPGVNASGNQDTTGNAATATALETSRTIQLTGDVTGSATFDGSANASITAVVQDDSHSHVISNVDGLQTALDSKTPTTRILTAGNGLTGGGTLAANRTFSVGAGGGITVGADTVSHADTSSQASVNNSGGTVIQDITLDTYGHLTGITSYNLDGRYYTETEANSRFIRTDGGTYSNSFTGNMNDLTGFRVLRVQGATNQAFSQHHNAINLPNTSSSSYESQIAVETTTGTTGMKIRSSSGGTFGAWQQVFTDGYHPNADTLTTARTINGVSFNGSANITVADSTKLPLAGGTMTGNLVLDGTTARLYDTDSYPLVQVSSSKAYFGSTSRATTTLASSSTITHTRGSNTYQIFTENYHPNADKWTTARTLSLSGDASGSVSWDGSANATLSVTVADDSHNHVWGNIDGAAVSGLGGPRFTTSSGYIEFGPANTTWAHIYTDRPNFYFNKELYVNNKLVWNSGNDGSGSGLDADLLDGVHGSSFLRSDGNDETTGALTISGSATSGGITTVSQYHSGADNLILKGNNVGISSIFFQSEKDGTNINHTSDFGFLQFHSYGTSTSGEANELILGVSNDADDCVIVNAPSATGFKFRTGASATDYTVWHAGNDGSGSGLDADLLDGNQASAFATSAQGTLATNALPKAGGTMTGNLTLDSGTSTTLNVKCDNGGNAVVRASGDSQGTGAFEVSQDAGQHGGGMSYNGDGTPAWASGEGSDRITFYRISGGSRSEVFSYSYADDNVDFNGNITLAGTVDGVDIAARNGVLTTTTNTANAALPKAGGTMTGDLVTPSITLAGNIVHQGDTNNYIGFHAADQFRVVNGGSETQEWGLNYTLLGDNKQFRLGNSSDFRMFFNGTDTYFRNYAHAGGDMYFQGEGSDGVNETALALDFSGTRSYVKLYEDSQERLRTNSSGIAVTGNITGVTDLYVADQIIHTGDTDTYMQFHAANQWRVVTGGTERLEVNNTQITSAEPIHAPSFHGDGSSLTGISGGDTISALQYSAYYDPVATSGNVGNYMNNIGSLNDWMMVGVEHATYTVVLPADQGGAVTRFKFRKKFRSFS
jgi:hypothetical protein